MQIKGTPSSAVAAVAIPGRSADARGSKERAKKAVTLDASASAAAALSAAIADFEAARVAIGKLKARSVAEVCQLKQTPPAVRQLLHAACAAMGKSGRVQVCSGAVLAVAAMMMAA